MDGVRSRFGFKIAHHRRPAENHAGGGGRVRHERSARGKAEETGTRPPASRRSAGATSAGRRRDCSAASGSGRAPVAVSRAACLRGGKAKFHGIDAEPPPTTSGSILSVTLSGTSTGIFSRQRLRPKAGGEGRSLPDGLPGRTSDLVLHTCSMVALRFSSSESMLRSIS